MSLAFRYFGLTNSCIVYTDYKEKNSSVFRSLSLLWKHGTLSEPPKGHSISAGIFSAIFLHPPLPWEDKTQCSLHAAAADFHTNWVILTMALLEGTEDTIVFWGFYIKNLIEYHKKVKFTQYWSSRVSTLMLTNLSTK